MPLLSDTEIDNVLTAIGDGRKVTIDPAGPNEVADLPAKYDGPTQREDLASGQVMASRPQVLVRLSAVEGKVVGGHDTGTQIRDEETLITYRAVDVLKDGIYARILLTKV